MDRKCFKCKRKISLNARKLNDRIWFFRGHWFCDSCLKYQEEKHEAWKAGKGEYKTVY